MGGATIAAATGTRHSRCAWPEAGRKKLAGVSTGHSHAFAGAAILLPVRARGGSRLHPPLGETGIWFADGSTACGTASGASVAGEYFARTARANGLRCCGTGGGTGILGKGNHPARGASPRFENADAGSLLTALRRRGGDGEPDGNGTRTGK